MGGINETKEENNKNSQKMRNPTNLNDKDLIYFEN